MLGTAFDWPYRWYILILSRTRSPAELLSSVEKILCILHKLKHWNDILSPHHRKLNIWNFYFNFFLFKKNKNTLVKILFSIIFVGWSLRRNFRFNVPYSDLFLNFWPRNLNKVDGNFFINFVRKKFICFTKNSIRSFWLDSINRPLKKLQSKDIFSKIVV